MTSGNPRSTAEIADHRARRRSRMVWALGVLFVVWQGSFYRVSAAGGTPTRLVEQVMLGAWLVSMVGLLVLIATGGGLAQRPEVRRLMNDDVSNANRASGQRWGFWAAVITALTVYGASFTAEFSVRDAAHFVLTFAIGAALLRWAVLERRAERAD